MLTLSLVVIGSIIGIAGLGVAAWSIITTEKRHRERLRRGKESVVD